MACSLATVLILLVYPAKAASFAIDPDPRSATLGDLVDRENAAARPSPAVAPHITRDPAIPREAVTVIVPGRKLRHTPDSIAR